MARRARTENRANSASSDDFHYEIPGSLVQKARVVFQNKIKKELTDDEAREMLERAVALFRLFIKWDRADKRRQAGIWDDSNPTQGETDNAGVRRPSDRENKPRSEFEVAAAQLRKSTRVRQQTPAEALQREGREER